MVVLRGAAIRHAQQAADLGRDGVGLARLLPQECAQTPFGQAEAIERRGVEEADASLPGACDRCFGIGVADGGEQSAERGGAESD